MRMYEKDGGRNIRHKNVGAIEFIRDFTTTLIEGRWRYTLSIFMFSFVGSWAGFAVLWQLIAEVNGDMEIDPLTGDYYGQGKSGCLRGAHDYTGFFLFSLEVQVTTGYGERYPSEDCPEGMFMLVAQIIVGLIIQGVMVAVVYSKLTRPPRHTGDFVFSRNCVICLRDGVLCLLFRISNFAEHQQINSRVEVYMCKKNGDRETDDVKLELENDGQITLYLPQIVCHTITEESPLFGYSKAELMAADFEILVTLTGNSKATGQTSQSRTSFLPREILWGYRFVNIIHYDQNLEAYTIDSQQFDGVYRVDTPLCSARRLQEVAEMPPDDLEEIKLKQDNEDSSYSLQEDKEPPENSLNDPQDENSHSPGQSSQSWEGFDGYLSKDSEEFKKSLL
ncbi:ATP-sensitive inward rectifier potassium channel 8-like [Lutzomyia longipalpis]|uniref:ATP-sensitive inward rectifier potassium channel 8-like n=1 Tax=Lutzomyia longipalpis TaxID=7200 RepID=UPI00248411BC|nr:ATP-sensitive inward rectifier potassium channel 8-like [Lutzomyia longipalpis]